jgi:acetyl esterase/lipase
MYKFVIILILSCSTSIYAQHYRLHPNIPTDSSYNVAREFTRQSPKYPFLTPALPTGSDSVIVLANLVYETLGSRGKDALGSKSKDALDQRCSDTLGSRNVDAVGTRGGESSECRELHLDVFLPQYPLSKRKPVVVLIHGGGWRSGDKDMEHYMAETYARNGIAAVCVEYRLSMEAQYPAAIQDIKTAIRWIRRNARLYGFDPSRVALHGESAGGQLASLIGSMNARFPKYQTSTLIRFSDRVQAVVDVDGVQAFIHPESSEGGDKPGKPSAGTMWIGVSSRVDSTLWVEASALTWVGAQSAPFLYIDSSIPRFTAGQHDMMKALRRHGIYCEEHKLEGVPHSFWLFHPWVDETMDYAVKFLKKVFNQ